MQFLLLSVLLLAQEWAVNYTIDYKTFTRQAAMGSNNTATISFLTRSAPNL